MASPPAWHARVGAHPWPGPLGSQRQRPDRRPSGRALGGTYKLGAYYPSTADSFVAALNTPPAQIVVDPRATYGSSFYTPGGTEFFTEPTSLGSPDWNPAFFGPNARLADVPEPATIALLGVGLALARLRAKRGR